VCDAGCVRRQVSPGYVGPGVTCLAALRHLQECPAFVTLIGDHLVRFLTCRNAKNDTGRPLAVPTVDLCFMLRGCALYPCACGFAWLVGGLFKADDECADRIVDV